MDSKDTQFLSATYRVQLNNEFSFEDCRRIIPYLSRLGISHLYTSPLFQASNGSTHGYDVCDYEHISSGLGGYSAFKALAETTQSYGMGIVSDIVPNHMGTYYENRWFRDVLQSGHTSKFSTYFDIWWESAETPPGDNGIVLPILGDDLDAEVRSGSISLEMHKGALVISYRGRLLPASRGTFYTVASELLNRVNDDSVEHQLLSSFIGELLTSLEVDQMKEVFASIIAAPALSSCAADALTAISEDPVRLHDVLRTQRYRLEHYARAGSHVNYRRFFDVADLIGVRMEDPEVFKRSHQALEQLIKEGAICGVRVDHPDGLRDPLDYLRRLEHLFPDSDERLYPAPPRIWVEKILARNEALRSEWPVAGTTGYEFLNYLTHLLIDPEGVERICITYREFVEEDLTFQESAHTLKLLVMERSFQSDLEHVMEALEAVLQKRSALSEGSQSDLLACVKELIACFPVYRTYVDSRGMTEQERAIYLYAYAEAKERLPHQAHGALDTTLAVLTAETGSEIRSSSGLEFIQRLQQLTAPVMAKGVEDTTFYRYCPLLSLNEVGGSAENAGMSVAEFHERMNERAASWPYTLSATATHDTKRGEDVRTRLNVLSHIPEMWREALLRWRTLNFVHARGIDKNTEYTLYQTLVGAWPARGSIDELFRERIGSYMQKAIHEAKFATSWLSPNQEYSERVAQFTSSVLSAENASFLEDISAFSLYVAHYGFIQSLSQVTLKFTCPGVPDTYQGCEVWDLSLVDPDNRRPVEWQRLQEQLDHIQEEMRRRNKAALASELLTSKEDGRIKHFLTYHLLQLRASVRDFALLHYLPLEVHGAYADKVIAFCRYSEESCIVSLTSRLVTLSLKELVPMEGASWLDTRVKLPSQFRGRFMNAFTDDVIVIDEDGFLPVARAFSALPVAVFIGKPADIG